MVWLGVRLPFDMRFLRIMGIKLADLPCQPNAKTDEEQGNEEAYTAPAEKQIVILPCQLTPNSFFLVNDPSCVGGYRRPDQKQQSQKHE